MENKRKEFKPFDRVLVRIGKENIWECDFYSHFREKYEYPHRTLTMKLKDENILPYEGNESLLGTTGEPEEEIVLKEGEWIIGIPLYDLNDFLEGKIYGNLSPFQGFKSRFELSGIATSYAIRLENFNPDDMEETRKHILCVKNGKIVRYKE